MLYPNDAMPNVTYRKTVDKKRVSLCKIGFLLRSEECSFQVVRLTQSIASIRHQGSPYYSWQTVQLLAPMTPMKPLATLQHS